MRQFPASAVIDVSAALAADLSRAARRVPEPDPRDLYDLGRQREIGEAVRASCRDGFDELVEETGQRLAEAPYSALVQGLDLDPEHRLFVALNRAFGDLVAPPYRKPRAQLVHHIQPGTDIKSAAAGPPESERLHTDAADWPEPADFISMSCVRPDKLGGGRSRLLDVDAFRRDVEEDLGADTVSLLEREAVPWRIADYLGGGVAWRPILTASRLRWRRYTVEYALAEEQVEVSAAMADALEAVQTTLERSHRIVDFLLAAGDLLIMDNLRALHARTPIHGDRLTSRRLMLRSWIRRPGAEKCDLSLRDA